MVARWDLILLAYACWQPCDLPPGEVACFTMQMHCATRHVCRHCCVAEGLPTVYAVPK